MRPGMKGKRMESAETKSLHTCCGRASELLDFLEAFYREELADAEEGPRLEELRRLQEKRDRSETAIGELKVLFAFLRKNGSAGTTDDPLPQETRGAIEMLEERLSDVVALARESSERSSQVRERILEGFRVLHAMHTVYLADKKGGASKGVLIDKEG